MFLVFRVKMSLGEPAINFATLSTAVSLSFSNFIKKTKDKTLRCRLGTGFGAVNMFTALTGICVASSYHESAEIFESVRTKHVNFFDCACIGHAVAMNEDLVIVQS